MNICIFSASGFPVIIKFQPATCNLQPAKNTCRVEARHLSAGILISVVSGVVKFFYYSLFRLNFSPKISLNILSLH